MKLYLAGKITGDGTEASIKAAFDKFMEASHELRIRGFEVVNPCELNFDKPDWNTCMRRDIAALMECDKICLLPDWTDSKGARLEFRIANDVGIPAVPYHDLVPASAPQRAAQAEIVAALDLVEAEKAPHEFNSGDLIAAMFRDRAGS